MQGNAREPPGRRHRLVAALLQESEIWDRNRVLEVQYSAQMHAKMWDKLEVAPDRDARPPKSRADRQRRLAGWQEVRRERDTLLRRVDGLETALEVACAY